MCTAETAAPPTIYCPGERGGYDRSAPTPLNGGRLHPRKKLVFFGNIVTDQSSNPVANVNASSGLGDPAGAFEDAQLLDQCRRGELAAFGPLVTKYQDRIFNVILRMCGNRDDAEELSQETFVKAFENLDRFRRDSRFYTWMFRIAVNLTISRRRRGGRVKFRSLDTTAGDNDESYRPRDLLPDENQPDPSEAAAKKDEHRRVMEALAELDDEFRAVVVLRDIEGMTYDQIADALKIPSGTVKSRLYRARCLLQRELRDLVT